MTMGDWPSLDFIGHLLGDHQAAAGGIQLISCMHHDIVEDIPLLTAAVQRYGGQIYDLSAANVDWTDPPGPIDAGRLGVVEGIVATVPDAMPGAVRFDATADGVVASVDGPGAATSPSLQLLLRAAAVMVSDALDRASITVIAASAVDADASRQELLWRLINADPQILNLHADRTIVTVLSGNPDPDLDYGRPQPLRYVALPDRILKRVEQPAVSALRTIKQHEGPVVLFLGAGASASAGISLGNAWRDAALSDLMGGRGDHDSLPEAFFQYLQDRDRFLTGERADRAGFLASLTLERVLRETFHELDSRPRADTAIVQRIARECTTALSTHRRGRAAIQGLISDHSKRIVVITVNFDQLIETGIEDQCLVLSTPEQFASESDKVAAYLAGDETQRVPVLKIHGSIDDPTTLVATIDSTAPGLHNDIRAVLDLVVNQGPPPTPWIWVGCSMRDRDVNAWLQSIAHGQLDEWWVDPFPGASLDEFVRLARDPAWTQSHRTLQDRLVIDTSDRFLERLRDRLQ